MVSCRLLAPVNDVSSCKQDRISEPAEYLVWEN
jgi:hypothetical protein